MAKEKKGNRGLSLENKQKHVPRERWRGDWEKIGKKLWREYLEPILVALALALFIRTFIFQPFRIPSGSMEDTLLVGDFLLANKFIYGAKIPFLTIRLPGFREPKRNDIIVFEFPSDTSKDFIKRIIATPGETIEIKDKKVFIDGNLIENPPTSKFETSYITPGKLNPRDNFDPITVPEGNYFVMGDNRDNSNDSRFWGFVPMENIVGKATILYWSWTHEPPFWYLPMELFKGNLHVRWKRIGSLIR